MDPPLKLFGQTIAFSASASASPDDVLYDHGTTSSGTWKELSSSPVKDGVQSGGSVRKSVSEASNFETSAFRKLSSSESSCEGDDKQSSAGEYVGVLVPPLAGGGESDKLTEESESADGDDGGLESMEGVAGQDASEDEAGGKGPKMPRRPDKAVACPRCHSLETKFCYYNNYNINQPRHFCKHCQRYWTAGGTLRNVPVGAGRRKNKHGSLITSRQTTEVGLVRADEADGAVPILASKGVALTMPMQASEVQSAVGGPLSCSSAPIVRVPVGPNSSDSNVPTLPYAIRVPSLEATYILTSPEASKSCEISVIGGSLPADSSSQGLNDVDGSRGWHRKDESSCSPAFGGGQTSCNVKGEPVVSSSEFRKDGDVTVSWGTGAAAPPYGFFNGGWPYGYNVGWNGAPAVCAGGMANNANNLPPPASIPGWSGAAPAGAMWAGMPWQMPGLAWSPAGWCPPWPMAPWAMGTPPSGTTIAMGPPIPTNCTSYPLQSAPAMVSGSPLGKHGRNFEGASALWAPKSLRMADPEEAMRSSVWRILGVGSRPDVATSNTFRAFEGRPSGKKTPDGDQQTAQTSLQANPAAMSRSVYFQETS